MSRQEKAAAQAAPKIDAARVMTAEQFFRKNPRPAWLVALAKSVFKGKVTTEAEWRKSVDSLARKKA